jgi:outer membrane lipoprotein
VLRHVFIGAMTQDHSMMWNTYGFTGKVFTGKKVLRSALFVVVLSQIVTVTGCAVTPPFKLEGVNRTITPKEAATDFAKVKGQKVLWGGIIVNSTNTEQGTQFEILAYPLDSNYKPQTSQNTLGRFIAIAGQYLETLDYAQGRLLSVTGTLKETKAGKIGDADYTYPVVTIDQHYLWKQGTQFSEPRVHFGVGVIFH